MTQIKVFDNTASRFSIEDNKFLIGSSIDGFNNFDISYTGSKVSYLARNVTEIGTEFESGIGTLSSLNNSLYLSRDIIVASSNNDQLVSFSPAGTKTLYTSINEPLIKNGLNNIDTKTSNFIASDYQTIYIVNISNGSVTASLPQTTEINRGLKIGFKLITESDPSSNSFSVQSSNSQLIDGSTNTQSFTTNTYVEYISSGTQWYSLQQDLTVEQGIPKGNTFSIQYNAGGGNFGGNNLKTDINGSLFISDNHLIQANNNVEINKNLNQYDFIVYGDSQNKNLYFSHSGQLGINMPVGYEPQTPLHIIQGQGSESIRVENRQNSNPATLTLFNRPSIVPQSGDITSKLNLSGKNSISSQIDYASIKSKILNSTNGITSGSLEIDIEDNGTTKNIAKLSGNKIILGIDNSDNNNIIIGNNNTVNGENNIILAKNLNASMNDTALFGFSNTNIKINTQSIDLHFDTQPKVSISDNVFIQSDMDVDGNVTANQYILSDNDASTSIAIINNSKIERSYVNLDTLFTGDDSQFIVKTGSHRSQSSDKLKIENNDIVVNSEIKLINNKVLPNSLLVVDENNYLITDTNLTIEDSSLVINSELRLNNMLFDKDNGSAGDVLVNNGSGYVKWSKINALDTIIDGLSMKWNQYNYKVVSVSDTRQQLIMNEVYSDEEFSIGDKIGIITNNITTYKTITDIVINNTQTVITLDSLISGEELSASIYSVNKGGYLSIGLDLNSEEGSTTTVLSNRPNTDTVFNTKKYNINYGIYGAADNYAMFIHGKYDGNNLNESPVVFNGTTPHFIDTNQYATVSINGYTYSRDLKADNIYFDAGIIEFTGV